MFTWIKKVARQNRFVGLAPPILTIVLLTAYSLKLTAPISVRAEELPEEQVFYYLHDHLGGIEAVLDEEGNVVERRDYLPYGNIRSQSEPRPDKVGAVPHDEGVVPPAAGGENVEGIAPLAVGEETYGFTGKELDSETDLLYFDQRYYDPEIGRFIQMDPLALGESDKPLESILKNPQVLNSYSYVTNNPLHFVDQRGEYQIDVHFDLTLYLGKAAGFSNADALSIAYYNQYTDINEETSPWNNETGWKHFSNRDVAESWVNEAIEDESIAALGQALHYYQDTYSHYANGYKFSEGGHILDSAFSIFGLSNNPDKTYNNVPQANKMAKGTFYSMRSYVKLNHGTGNLKEEEYDEQTRTIWNEIKGNIEAFNSASDDLKGLYLPQNSYEKFMRSFIDNE